MLTAAERDGCHSHGLFRLPSFLKGCVGGILNPAAEPHVLDLLPGVVKVDGKGGFQQAAQEAGFPLLLQKAKSQGVAMMGVVNTRGMSGAMWWPAEQLALEGVVSIICCNTPGYVSRGVGSARRVFGTNPLAFGWPRPGREPPYVWDQATSVMARGEIQVAQRDGHPIVEGAGVDPTGALSTDPAAILAGAQLPFGQHKGANIAAMIELLSAAMFGTDLAVDQPAGTEFDVHNRGLFVLAIDASRLEGTGTAAADHGEHLLTALLDGENARLPGDRRRAHRRQVTEDGLQIDVPEALHATILDLVAQHAKAQLSKV